MLKQPSSVHFKTMHQMCSQNPTSCTVNITIMNGNVSRVFLRVHENIFDSLA